MSTGRDLCETAGLVPGACMGIARRHSRVLPAPCSDDLLACGGKA